MERIDGPSRAVDLHAAEDLTAIVIAIARDRKARATHGELRHAVEHGRRACDLPEE
jgi:hypothetical protein